MKRVWAKSERQDARKSGGHGKGNGEYDAAAGEFGNLFRQKRRRESWVRDGGMTAEDERRASLTRAVKAQRLRDDADLAAASVNASAELESAAAIPQFMTASVVKVGSDEQQIAAKRALRLAQEKESAMQAQRSVDQAIKGSKKLTVYGGHALLQWEGHGLEKGDFVRIMEALDRKNCGVYLFSMNVL